ncbi:IclR family transcriptional regulator [Pigmentiphaga sp. GD03639]|uniref:IclR family transcriptional regulator n=2 Tax=Pigmentiphaga daeguensis TaxID=414049 RepID=A0ABP3MS48_9BURK|nr:MULTISPECIES: IclR family transcriptional regulator [unclassified Pigmentiphaga]MDH2235649.1 IclR family transcriptional regulator [Pigmentiphaga sp. GD03639]OVZ61680.1 transcriptional regulator [Pigmentiphaga sp. NML030171]
MGIKRKPASTSQNESVRAVSRALDILKAFTVQDPELTATELLDRVDLSRPTLYRLLYTLEDSGFLVSSGDPQKFNLGPAVAHLSHVWTASLNLAELAEPVLRNVWKLTGETVALFVRQGDYRLCIAEFPSAHALSFKRGIGHRERLVFGASGHAILAHMEMTPQELKDYLAGVDVDFDAYRAELEFVRSHGYAVSKEELLRGAVSIAAPFFDKPGKVAGAIVVFGPSARLGKEQVDEIAALVSQESRTLTRLLCGSA